MEYKLFTESQPPQHVGYLFASGFLGQVADPEHDPSIRWQLESVDDSVPSFLIVNTSNGKALQAVKIADTIFAVAAPREPDKAVQQWRIARFGNPPVHYVFENRQFLKKYLDWSLWHDSGNPAPMVTEVPQPDASFLDTQIWHMS